VVKIKERKEEARMKKDVRERIREKINGWRAAGNKRDRKYASEEIIGKFINPFFSFRHSGLLDDGKFSFPDGK